MIFAWISFTIAFIYLAYSAHRDIKTRHLNNKLAWALIYVGLILAVLESIIFNPIYFFVWIGGLLLVTPFYYYFFKLGREKDSFGGGDFWMLLTTQALLPALPVPAITLLAYAIGGITLAIFSRFYKKSSEGLPLAPFFLIGVLVTTLIF